MQPTVQAIIINIDDALEAVALRSALEWWQVHVTLYHIGAASDLVAVLRDALPPSPLIFLLCHGDERGILLPELAPAIAATQPYQTFIGAHELRQFLRLPGGVIVNTGCVTGTPDLAAAFLSCGVDAYVLPSAILTVQPRSFIVCPSPTIILFVACHCLRPMSARPAIILRRRSSACFFRR